MNEQSIKSELEDLKQFRQELITVLLDDNRPEGIYEEKLFQYKERRAEFLLELVKDYEVIKVNDSEIRTELKAFIKEGDEIVAKMRKAPEKNVKNFAKILDDQLKPEFEPDRERELESSLFYSWFHPSDYVYGLIETGTIVIKHIEFPEKLKRLIFELRSCLIFQNYLAAGIMLRTIAEVAVEDVLRKEFDNVNLETHGERLSYLEAQPKFAIPAGALNAYRKELNEYVHGKKLANGKFIKQYVSIILEQVQELYEKVD